MKTPAVPKEYSACATPDGRLCGICHARVIDYEREVVAKERALRAFAARNKFLPSWRPLVISPAGRWYRTVSKRKVFRDNRSVTLGLIVENQSGRIGGLPVGLCAIEPRGHAKVYGILRSKLLKSYAAPLADVLRHVAIRGGEKDLTVIFSVSEISTDSSRALNTLSKSLTHEAEEVAAVYLYLDDSRGTHYLGRRNPHARQVFKRLYGSGEISERINGKDFIYHPLAFSQVNPAVAGLMAQALRAALRQRAVSFLYDLYCGYGLFGLLTADLVRGVLGIEQSPLAVGSAIANARRQKVRNVRFARSDLTPDSVRKRLSGCSSQDFVILDPPRNGTVPGVIESVASFRIERAAHLICNVDLLPAEAGKWQRSGYRITSITPFDMFPGTDDVELLALLERSAS